MSTDSLESNEHFDLLPFISIMMCTLGCLLLIALSMASLSLGSAGEEWTTNTKDSDKQPILLIWDGTLLTADLGKDRLCVAWQPSEPTPTCPPGYRLATRADVLRYFADRRRTHYALVAVRPSGFANFDTLQQDLLDNRIETGSEPIAQTKQVRLGAVGIHP
jgi:hypothetical protein